MQHGDDPAPLGDFGLQDRHGAKLMQRVERGDRLVGDQPVRLDRQRTRHQRPRPLAARKFGDAAAAQFLKLGRVDGAFDRLHVRGVGRTERGAMRQAAERDDRFHFERPVGSAALREIGDAASERRTSRAGRAVVADLPFSRLDQASESPGERRLAGAVGSDEPDELARRKAQRDARQRDARAVTDGEIADLDPHQPSRRERLTSISRNGAPTSEVTTPSFSSGCVGSTRTSTSAATSSTAPAKPDTRSSRPGR